MDKIAPKTSNYTTENPPYTLLPSTQALQQYGVPKSVAEYMLHNFWDIGEEYKDLVSIYYLLNWRSPYFAKQLQNGTLEREGILYQVRYYRCDSYQICQNGANLALSFRALQAEYDSIPVVLVAII